jgi:hypothetical protein
MATSNTGETRPCHCGIAIVIADAESTATAKVLSRSIRWRWGGWRADNSCRLQDSRRARLAYSNSVSYTYKVITSLS